MTVAERSHGQQQAAAPRSESWSRVFQLSTLAGLAVGVGISGAYLLWRASDVANPACRENPDHRLLPDYLLVAWSVGCVVAGRVLGPKLHPVPEDERAERLADSVGILTAMLFLATVTFALIYEGIGVQASLQQGLLVGNFHQLEPITFYVRCAIFYDKSNAGGMGIWTYAVFGLTAFLAGHWLWSSGPPARAWDPDENKRKRPPSPLARALATLLTLSAVGAMLVAGYAFLQYALNANPNTVAVVGGAVRAPTLPADIAVTEGTFRAGILAVIAFVTVFFLVIALLDWYFALRRWDSIGLRVQRWARANVWYAFGLLSVVGALVAHFGGNEIRYS